MKTSTLAALCSSVILTSAACAELVNFDLVWETDSGTQATGTISVNTDWDFSGPNPVFSWEFSDQSIQDCSVSIPYHDGIRGYETSYIFFAEVLIDSTLNDFDLSTNLVGQDGFDGIQMLSEDAFVSAYGFNMFYDDVSYFTLTSMTAQNIAVVPLPPAGFAGLGMLGLLAIKRRMK